MECTLAHRVEVHYKIFYDIDDDDDDDDDDGDRRIQLQHTSVMLAGLKLEFSN